MEEQAATLLAALKKPSAAVDTKLQLFNNLKSNIKHLRVPESAQAPIFECIKLAITATTSAALVSTGFSTLGHLIKRLVLQNQTGILTHQSHKLLPILLDRLGDARESHRNAASQILSDIWPFDHAEVETLIREQAIKGTNPRAKEMAMQWVVKMNKNEGLPFRSFVPLLVANLEDADAGVREVAKTAVVELFNNAPEHAKADLKKQLVTFNVRKSIAAYITAHLSGSSMTPDAEMPPPPAPISVSRAQSLQPDTGFADALEADQPPQPEAVIMDPIHVYTSRELDEIFRSMASCFEGRESEQNWLARDKNVMKLRRITKGNAPSEFHGAFVAGIKSLLDGILKVANSLRTTMSTNGCQLIQELAKTIGTAMDPWVEILLQNFIKMCAATKNIAAQNGNVTVDTILSNVSYTSRILQHVSLATQDKNVQPRMFAAGWVKTLIRKHKSAIEHSGLDVLEKILTKALIDANPKVRESFRSTYWRFALVWPARGETIMNTLGPRDRNALEKDPNNPNASLASSQTSAASLSKSVGPAAARTTLKEKIAEQKRARLAAAKGGLERPSSAQASYSPVKSQSAKSLGSRTTSNASTASSNTARPPSAMGGTTKSALSSNGPGTGSLLSGTVRRPIRPRPELTRPATADPYASRRAGAKNITPSMTPERSPGKETVKKSVAPKSTVRPRAQTQQSPNVSPIRNKTKAEPTPLHRKNPSGSSRHGSPALTPSKNEELTMVLPFGKSHSDEHAVLPYRRRDGTEKTIVQSTPQDLEDEDAFTMVIPHLAQPPTQAAQRSPPKTVSDRLGVSSPRSLRSPRSVAEMTSRSPMGATRSPRMRSPEHSRPTPSDSADEVQVYEDPFVGEEPGAALQEAEKPVLEELPLNEKSGERRQSTDSVDSNTMMGDGSTPRTRGHQKTTSTGSVMHADNSEQSRPEVLKNRQLLISGINKIRNRTVDPHMFRRLQEMIKSNQDIWGTDDERFGELLLVSLEYLEAPAETLKVPPMKAANLKVQVLATVRAMLALYRRETAKYFSRVLCAVLKTKSQYENTSHIASDLEATADEITRYGQTSDCLNAVLDLLESSISTDTISPNSSVSSNGSIATVAPNNRTTTMALMTLSNLLHMASERAAPLSEQQTQRLGKLAVRLLDDTDADVRKADMEFCISLHERIGGDKEVFWKAVAGAREQHLNLITYFLAKRGKA
jgi:CLIP-associating protein 1/2